HVDRHAFRMDWQTCKSCNHSDAILKRLAHANDAAATNMNARFAYMIKRVEAVLIDTRADNLAIEFRRRIEIVIVVVQATVLQPPRLIAGKHAERDARFHPKRLHAFDHLANLVEVAVFGRSPGRAHAEP